MLFSMALFVPAQGFPELPAEVSGWKRSGEDRVFDRETLYAHIDGGAELFLTYDFRRVLVRRYEHPTLPSILVEVYDMGSSAEAFGIFSCERGEEEFPLGQGADFGGGQLRFWKGRYFVSLIALGRGNAADKAMLDLARRLEEAIETKGDYPDLVERLPSEGLAERTIRYFHSVRVLNNIYFLSREDILHLEGADCVFAKYEEDSSSTFLLLVEYNDAASAQEAERSFLAAYLPDAGGDGIARVENGTWAGIRLRGEFLAVVLDATNREYATKILEGVLDGN